MGIAAVAGLLFWLQTPDVTALSQQGAAALRAGRLVEAEKAYRQLVTLEPANPAWRRNLGIALHSARRYGDAIPELQAYLKSDPKPGPLHLLLGLSYLKLSQPCPAIAPLEKARAWNIEQTILELADAYYGCNRFEPAARAYAAALGTRHKSPAVARQAAHCFWQARLYPEARTHFEAVAAQFAADGEFAYEYGDTLVRQEGPEAGLPHLRRAVAALPDLLPAQAEFGKALLETGAAAESIPHLEAASRQDETLLLPLSRAYRAAGRSADADRTQQEYRKRAGGR